MATRRRPRPGVRELRLSPAAAGNLHVLALLPRVNAGLTAALAAAIALGVALGVAFTFASGALVGAVSAAVAGGWDSGAAAEAVRALAAAAALYTLRQVAGPVSNLLAHMLAWDLDRHLEARVMRAVNAPASIAHLEDPRVRDLVATAKEVGSGEFRPGSVVVALRNLLPFWLQSVVYAAVLSRYAWWMALGLLAVAHYAASVVRSENVRAAQVVLAQGGTVRRSQYLRELATTPAAAKEIRVFGLVGWLSDGFDREWLASMVPFWRGRAAADRKVALVSLLVAAAQGLAALSLAWSAARGEIDLASLTVFLGALPGICSLGVGNADDDLMAYGGVAVPALLQLEAKLRDAAAGEARVARDAAGASPNTAQLGDVAPSTGIAFERVTFRYPGGTADVLSGLDLVIPAGTSLAIVGANGAGKTTIVKLLCGLYEPSGGRITVDGVDLRDIDPRAWRRRVAAIFQDFIQYHLTARENVALGAAGAPGWDRPVKRHAALADAARRAGALGVIEALRNGWDTVLSREYAGGAELSGGEWQRVALARAFYAVEDGPRGAAAGARVLILDEPTANLDVRAEAALYERFLDLTRGLTTIVISHRFSTVRRADRICVVEGGRAVELGTHEELLAATGRYAAMFRLQADRFDNGASGAGTGGGTTGSLSENTDGEVPHA